MAALPLALALLLAARAPPNHAQGGAEASPRLRPTVAGLALAIRSRAIQDSRCYLMNGGAVESFYIPEDTPVGSVIGVLSINGDPSDHGDITLRLQEKNAAVGVATGTKNVTLLRALDREERSGPSNVYVNVRCDRRRTTDPTFIIPVSVRVWDVNDNAPVWAGAPFRARVSELATSGARVLALKASDADQAGPHATIHYAVMPGPHSEYFEFPNELESILVIKKPLDFESQPNLTVTLRASDQGSPPKFSDAELTVEVLDADDQNPKFEYEHYTAVLPDDAQEGTYLGTSPAPISAWDQDLGIAAPVQYSAAGAAASLLAVAADSGRIAATSALLRESLPVTVVIKATQIDNPDRYALATLTITLASPTGPPPTASPGPLTSLRPSGAPGASSPGPGGLGSGSLGSVRFSRRHYAAAAAEDTRPGAVLVTLQTDPPRVKGEKPLQFYVSERGFLEKFAINAAGDVVLRAALDYEAMDSYHYQVMVTDGVANDTATLNISVLNVNEWEPRFKYPQYEFRVDDSPDGVPGGGAAGGLLPVGKLDVHDGDKPDKITLSLRGADAGMFYINESGELFVRRAALRASADNASDSHAALHVLATARDDGAPPRQSSVPVVVHVSPAARSRPAPALAALAAFAAALALLAVLVFALLAYIYRSKRKAGTSKPRPAPLDAHKPRSLSAHSHAATLPPLGSNGVAGAGVGAGVGVAGAAGSLGPAGGSAGSLLSVSAGASTILANSSSSLDLRDTLPTSANGGRNATISRQSHRFPTKTKIAPAPPALESDCNEPGLPGLPGVGVGVAGGGVALMSDHVGVRGAGRSGVAWPAATIPARVKKLSWDDAQHDTHHTGKGSGEPNDATNPAMHDNLNLTVYF